MMKSKIISMLMLAALAIMAGACSSDDDDEPGGGSTDPEKPVTEYLTPGNDQRPDWRAPDYTLYGGITMAVQVELGDTLANYQSGNDLMCAKIGDEVRAVTPPLTTGGITYYPLSIAGDGTGQAVSLHYYCDRLHRIFTIKDWATFDASTKPTGESSLYRPCFLTSQ